MGSVHDGPEFMLHAGHDIFTSSVIKFSILEACLSRWNIFFDRKGDDSLK